MDLTEKQLDNKESNNDILYKIQGVKDDYYNNHNKNIFFKNAQKFDLAQQITSQISVDQLLDRCIYRIKNTDGVMLDYTIFKLFATPELYPTICDKIMAIFHACIQDFGNFTVHVNLDGFTASAAHRYKSLIETFNYMCVQNPTQFSLLLKNWYIYNTPSSIELIVPILKNLFDPVGYAKKVIYNKKESPQKLALLLLN